jgi:choline kinase
MVASLMCAADRLDGSDDVLIAYTDIAYEPRILRSIIDCDAALAVTVDRSWLRLWRLRSDDPLRDAETLRLGEQGRILELGKRPRSLAEIEGQYMGIIRASAAVAPRLVRFYEGLDPRGPYDGKDRDNMFMTSFLQCLIDTGQPLQAVLVDGGWLEVDTVADVEKYAALDRAGTLREICDLRAAT